MLSTTHRRLEMCRRVSASVARLSAAYEGSGDFAGFLRAAAAAGITRLQLHELATADERLIAEMRLLRSQLRELQDAGVFMGVRESVQ